MAPYRVLEHASGDDYLVSSLRTLKYGSSLLSVFFIQPDGENITQYKVEYICISWRHCKFSLSYGVMPECYFILAAFGMSCPQLWKAEILMLDIMSSWLERAYLETVNQLNNTGIILNISMHLESLELAIEPKYYFHLCNLHKFPHLSHDSDPRLTTY